MESLGNKRQVGVCLVVAITVISITGWRVPPRLMKRKQKRVVKGHRYQSRQLLKPLQSATFVLLPNYQCCLPELKGVRVCVECVWSCSEYNWRVSCGRQDFLGTERNNHWPLSGCALLEVTLSSFTIINMDVCSVLILAAPSKIFPNWRNLFC